MVLSSSQIVGKIGLDDTCKIEKKVTHLAQECSISVKNKTQFLPSWE